jgi:hypothetical protein
MFDERLIRRGELLLSLDFLKGYDGALKQRSQRLNAYIEYCMAKAYIYNIIINLES